MFIQENVMEVFLHLVVLLPGQGVFIEMSYILPGRGGT